MYARGLIEGSYDLRLVTASALIAVLVTYLSIILISRAKPVNVSGGSGMADLLMRAGMLGTGLWCMHFVAMLAFQVPIAMHMRPAGIVVSLLYAIGVCALGMYLVSHRVLSLGQWLGSGLVAGFGLASIYYVAMAMVETEATILYEPALVLLSVALPICVTNIALMLVLGRIPEGRFSAELFKLAGAVLLGTAFIGTHYAAMAATFFHVPKIASLQSDAVLGVVPTAVLLVGITMALGIAVIVSLRWDQRMNARDMIMTRVQVGIVTGLMVVISMVILGNQWLGAAYRRQVLLLDISQQIERRLALVHLAMEHPDKAAGTTIDGFAINNTLALVHTMLRGGLLNGQLVEPERDEEIRAALNEFVAVMTPDTDYLLKDIHQLSAGLSAAVVNRIYVQSGVARSIQNALLWMLAILLGCVYMGFRRYGLFFHAKSRELEEALSQLTYQKLVLDEHAIVSIADRRGDILYANDKFCSVSGYSPEELIGQNHRIVKSSAYPPEFYEELWRTISHGHVWKGIICNRRKNGSNYWVNATIVPCVGADGKIYQYISARTDITNLVLTEKQLAEANRDLEQRVRERTGQLEEGRKKLEHDRNALRLVIEGTSNVTGANFFPMLANYLAEALGVSYVFVIKKVDEHTARIIASWTHNGWGEPQEFKVDGMPCESLPASNQPCYFPQNVQAEFPQAELLKSIHADSYYGVPLKDSANGYLGHIAIIHDGPFPDAERVISLSQIFAARAGAELERMTMEAAMEAVRDKATRANQVKSQFLASMSHELRTPLNAIIGFSGAMLQGVDGPVNEEQAHSLKFVNDGGKHLLELISDLLDISKIEAGRMELHREDTDLAAVADQSLAAVRVLANDKGLMLRSEIQKDLPRVYGDPMRLKQVMLNLLSNAIKFTDKGEVVLGIRTAEDDAPLLVAKDISSVSSGKRMVIVSVSDTGTGIAPQDIELVFEEFRQTKQGAKKERSTGLGLAISRRFVEMHGGVIRVESTPGAGSTFYFTIPVDVRQSNETLKQAT
ncbi:MAG: multi-sensor hybrid histidine kinase [Gammaproteobacteria bacterium]|nr:MAG: multi-sensor hybrid histidine kinase [Gammaproteobacteria bacterium]TND02446.1 MAG: multi-sensor hybrid histidine kinase [Gammaproteobacteria bacterium]